MHLAGGIGSIEPFVESVPQTFIQTGFFLLGRLKLVVEQQKVKVFFAANYMTKTFQRFCTNDIKQPCAHFLNLDCPPCEHTLDDPYCMEIQYIDRNRTLSCRISDPIYKVSRKSDEELQNCRAKKNKCDQEFNACKGKFDECLDNCTDFMYENTLLNYSDKTSKTI